MTIEFYNCLGSTIALVSFKGNGYYASGKTKNDCIARIFEVTGLIK